MRELYINGFLIDLYPKDAEPIATSYQISNIAEFEDVQANFSNTFAVPKTENNVSRLGNADMIGSNSFVAYRKNPARYLNNGIDVVDNGFNIVCCRLFSSAFQVTADDVPSGFGVGESPDEDIVSKCYMANLCIADLISRCA